MGEDEFCVRELGLAAYMRIKGLGLQSVSGDSFVFKMGDQSLEQWRIEYSNSECCNHDSMVMTLKKLRVGEKFSN